MMHRVECGGPDDCDCPCRCHDRCGYPMPNAGEPCFRLRGHSTEHRTRSALENACSMWDNRVVEYSDGILHNRQRPGSPLYSAGRGVDISEYRRDG